jgi:hypothetical protein
MNDVMDAEVTSLATVAPPLAPVQRVQTGYTTAMQVQRPRQLAEVARRLNEEATLAGEAFYYGWGAGKDRIEGASIKLANAAVRCYGNCAIEMAPLQETHDAWIFTAMFIDLETGFTLPRQFRQSKKLVVYGKHDEARKEDIRFQIGQSKAIRNLVLNAMPIGLIDQAMEVAMSGARKKLEAYIAGIDKAQGAGKGLVQAVDMVMKGLAKHNAKEDAVLLKLGVAERKAIDLDRLLMLRANLTALDNGEVRVEELYPPAKTDALADKLEAGKKTDEKPAKKEAKKPAGSGPNGEYDPSVDEPGLDASNGKLFGGDDADLDAQAK